MSQQTDEAAVTDAVRENYGSVAASTLSNRDAGVRAVATAFGYSEAELGSIPAEANMGLSCGNPTAMASLRPGEVVVDLGSGGGLDVFLASKKVGPTGRAIGVDMTPAMLDRARRAAEAAGYENVEFLEGSIDKLPLPDGSVDCIISNCVINLAPDKSAVFEEMFRVLKPGGRVAVSDIALKKELPTELARDVLAYVGCIAGAIPIREYVTGLARAGFGSVQVVDAGANLNAYASVEGQSACCSPPMKQGAGSLPIAQTSCCGSGGSSAGASSVHGGLAAVIEKYDVNEYAASVKVYAVKPG
jgi:SAM-dependent methyltransferase